MSKHSGIANINLLSMRNGSETARRIDESLRDIVEEQLELKGGDVILIKPNLTLPWYVAGACTSKRVIESLCAVLRDKNCKIGICEGDGGVASYSAHEAFAGNKLLELSHRFGVEFISLSLLPRRKVCQVVEEREITFDLPRLLTDREFDIFINLPVLKVHVFTLLSLSMKNLWGCIPDPLRIHYHKSLHRGIVALWKTIRPDLSIIDGLVAMDGNGPMNGIPVPLGVIVGGSGDATVDRVGAAILGIPFRNVKHLLIAEKEGLIHPMEQVRLSHTL